MRHTLRLALLAVAGLMLAGCQAVVLDPAGHVASEQRDLLVISVLLMLIVIVPVMALTIFFAWKYRASNKEAKYEPDWDHSTQLEVIIWAAPLLIIICLGAVTWSGTHLLDPYRPLDRIDDDRPVAADTRPLEVQVVALDWKWLFIYPEYGIATVNELAAPIDRPIRFSLTSSSVMNSFYIPALAGQIYAMPGMETKLHGVANELGRFEGFSANYSGDGFSGMDFDFLVFDEAGFQRWLGQAQGAGPLDRYAYLELSLPSEHDPVQRFGSVEPRLWAAIVEMCVDASRMCMGEMAAIDARGGGGLDGARNTWPISHDRYTRRGQPALGGSADAYVMSLCTPEEAADAADLRAELEQAAILAPRSPLAPLRGAGLSPSRSERLVRPAYQTAALDTMN